MNLVVFGPGGVHLHGGIPPDPPPEEQSTSPAARGDYACDPNRKIK